MINIKNKNILVTLGSFDSGGVSKSTVNLVNELAKNDFNVDFLIFGGVYPKEILHKKVRLIDNMQFEKYTKSLLGGLFSSLIYFDFQGFIQLVRKLLYRINSRSISAHYMSRILPKINKEYDLAIDCNGQQYLYYLVDKISAKKKISIFHSDYAKWDYYYSIDRKYYPFVDEIFTISNTCADSLKKYFPDCERKIRVFENIIDLRNIEKLKSQKLELEKVGFNDKVFNIVTVGHVQKSKGSDLALKSANILKDSGVKFQWTFVGLIKEKEILRLVKSMGLQDYVRFVGMQPNPYPFIESANLIVHPSLYEGKSIALDEAKYLCKPIIVTNYSTVQDQFNHGVNGFIVSFRPEDIASKIKQCIQDEYIVKNLIESLKKEKLRNQNQIEIIREVLSG